jgi:hypothetical protein
MPLNVQNKTYVTVDDESKQPPINRKSIKHTPFLKYFIMGLFIVIVVSSSVFLIYIYILGHQEVLLTSPETIATQIADTTSAIRSPEIKEIQTPVANVSPVPIGQTFYTIYIAAYRIEPPADEEVSRWNDAGYISAVVDANKHFNVALGQYATIVEARAFAEQMFDAFENGYIIGKIK